MDELNEETLFLTKLEKQWNDLKKAKSGWVSTTINLSIASKFFLDSLDEAIRYAESNIKQEVFGAESDKKAFVMTVISNLYDKVISPYLPYILYPVSGYIKQIVMMVVGITIDWFVAKYNSGSWKME